MTGKVHWRCFHCGETFTKAQVRWAEEHFGYSEDNKPVCKMRVPGESGLLAALRNAEKELRSYRSEDSHLLRAMQGMQADHRQALIREEERGYARGISSWQDIEAVAKFLATSYSLGAWMSAALDDPAVGKAMKQDIVEWFDSMPEIKNSSQRYIAVMAALGRSTTQADDTRA